MTINIHVNKYTCIPYVGPDEKFILVSKFHFNNFKRIFQHSNGYGKWKLDPYNMKGFVDFLYKKIQVYYARQFRPTVCC